MSVDRTNLRRLVSGLGLALALAVGGCGGSDQDESTGQRATTEATPTTVTTETTAPAPDDGADAEVTAGGDGADVEVEVTAGGDGADVEVEVTAGGDGADVEVDGEVSDTAVQPVSFAESVQPVITSTCARCHTGDGPGTPHIRFDTAADVAADAFAVALNVETGVMPPWPASDQSVAFLHDWSPSADEVQAIKAWQQAGAPLDVDPTTAMVPVEGVIGLEDADIELTPTATYDGVAGQPDEYRCFIYDPQLDEERYLEAYDFVPDQTAVVHHAIGYRIPAPRRDLAESRNGADGQGGWSCFGSSGIGVRDIFLGWAPGQTPTVYDEGSGLRMGPGDFIVVQIHYHFDEEAPADNSALRLRWAEAAAGEEIDEIVVSQYFAPAEIPCGPDEEGPLCDRDAAMRRALAAYGQEGVQTDFITAACGYSVDDFAHMTDGIATGRCDQPVTSFGEIVSVLGHEHELGKSFRMTLNPGTADETILLDIPRWDFEWQFNYYPAQSIMLEPGDWVRIECSWDRSLRDPDLEPAYVFWADGTNDEMCFSTIVTRPI